MATIVLSAAGAAIGGSVGGGALGLSSVALGRFAGASLGRVLDQRLMGQGSDVVEHGRTDRFRLTGAGEGAPVAQVFGRVRVGGHVIWASAFEETVTSSGGGKGAPSRPRTDTYTYSVSLAVALCEGRIGGVLRVWADGAEISPDDLNMRVYDGSASQLPDAKIEAIEGAGAVPAYRGTAYVVFEDLALEHFGNRVPQFSFEVLRPAESDPARSDPAHDVRAVALMPGTGEYALATTRVTARYGPGESRSLNVNSPSGQTDMATSMTALGVELPGCEAASLIVSWFGDDLRAGQCSLCPKVEQTEFDGEEMPWGVSGLTRGAAQSVPQENGSVIYGGTPADKAVIEAIRHIQSEGRSVLFYPFILMEQLDGNGRKDPWTGAADQPRLPWRGRITGAMAPGMAGTSDRTAAADSEVSDFVGTVVAADFTIGSGTVVYTGPEEWSYSRFILHYAALCAAAGGVEAFCIGSEMRGLTQLRGANDGFPFVRALKALAGECRALLGPGVKISYAADWSEYFGYQPADGSGDRYFHLDPLWADANIDFIGIDNYMPLSDWRDTKDHADAEWGSIYDLGYLKSNVAGGEGFDWYYHSDEARQAQIRTPITDEAHDEPWIWRYKDLRGWWENRHHERIAGTRQPTPTAWVPGSKPIWFTEFGCAAIDKGANQPNKFLDAKSSESALPYFSDGRRDDYIQRQYLRAVHEYWADPSHNPVSDIYNGPMLDMRRAFVWAYDTRPYPFFPGNQALWSDGENHARGHWISGRMASRSLASVVEEICANAGLPDVETHDLHGILRGYSVTDVETARGLLQPLMLAHGFDAVERDGVLRFIMRAAFDAVEVEPAALVENGESDGALELTRAAEAELSGRVRLQFVETDANFEVAAEEAVLPDQKTHSVSTAEMPVVMTRREGRQVLERWLAEARVARDTLRLALPPSRMAVGAGDVLRLEAGLFRIDRVEQGMFQTIEAVRIDPGAYAPAEIAEVAPRLSPFVVPVPVEAQFMDLPLIRGNEDPQSPHIAVSARPWPGSVAVYSSTTDSDFALDTVLAGRASMGVLETPLMAGPVGSWDRGNDVQVRLIAGQLQSVGEAALLSGANLAAIGTGTADQWELLQFQHVEPLGARRFLLRRFLRGQFGSDGQMPNVWPAGSRFVLMDRAPEQVMLPANARGLARHYRVGQAQRPFDDPSYTAFRLAFDGVGLRPYAPVHLRGRRDLGGVLEVDWIRRTRIGGDSWGGVDVPLGEESESYLLRVEQQGRILREVNIKKPAWIYDPDEEEADTGGEPYEIAVAQVSATVGPGYFARLAVKAA
ncbi:glycoside hydrolase/phage tail family protein [Lutimaribacter sp. EGI FJ00015]|uniref:Glycoside hydrolase/phage tail family protein n=1 Tax=Lutimaribacter degradans TaxID=2945989 RepID=A0ACC5ZS95_9RHOB|nr:glycoside hydrolase/phage tail family protein [Lutimaribacter sp. EGI FJ00013]MCM2561043.1 glycoside hydrolase/phage tail family protein [Lutimaribacter sp. EGI FJ00013]MCO0612010.1 glycoside hydrolase/phage tail family protein [Lutimaribacter sp. EGI FJ00015]MCO0634870.1 glycoside hydrolase/phage tail family protein [Lutimaribacter sp. EGI FJ00014]